MKANIKILRKQRHFSDEFKRGLVTDFESGKLSVGQLSKLHGIAEQVIYSWIHKFSIFNEKGFRIIEMKESTSKKVNELEQKVKELERLVGQKQIKIDYLEKMMEIAQEELNIDIKKNYNTSQSAGSGTTTKK